jgi:hypothetical protein
MRVIECMHNKPMHATCETHARWAALDSMSTPGKANLKPRITQGCVAFVTAIALVAAVAVAMNAWSEPTVLIVPFVVFPATAGVVAAFFKPMRLAHASLLGAFISGACILAFVSYAASRI